MKEKRVHNIYNSEEEEKIIGMLFERSEEALELIRRKFEPYCHGIAPDIDWEDFQECFDDMLLRVWDSIPPEYPQSLRRYVVVIFRRLVINMLIASGRRKRGGGRIDVPLEEGLDIFDPKDFADAPLMAKTVAELTGKYLRKISKKKRVMFIKRYWYLNSVNDIADLFSVSPNTVKSVLHRTREELRKYLRENGVDI